MKLKYRKIINKAIAIGCLVAVIVLFSLLKTNGKIAEYFFARGLSRGYNFLSGNIASWFPFAVFDVFVICGITAGVIGVAFIIYFCAKKKKWKALDLACNYLIAALCIALVYTSVASGNYYRDPLPVDKYEGEQLSAEETARLLDVLLDDFVAVSDQVKRNQDGSSVCPYTFRETVDLIRAEYEKLNDDYFASSVPSAKEAVFSGFLTSEGITGITFMPTGDAVVNAQTPSCYKVVTIAHELAHTVGVMREGDANLMAYYVLLRSDVPYFRYCAYMYGLWHLTDVLFTLDEDLYVETIKKYPMAARIERKLENDFWATKKNFMEDIGDFFNDLYLKLSGSKEGVDSYHDYSDYYVVRDEETSEVIQVQIEYSLTTRVILKIAQDRSSALRA